MISLFKHQLSDFIDNEKYRKRLDEELIIIEKFKFGKTFIQVYDLVQLIPDILVHFYYVIYNEHYTQLRYMK